MQLVPNSFGSTVLREFNTCHAPDTGRFCSTGEPSIGPSRGPMTGAWRVKLSPAATRAAVRTASVLNVPRGSALDRWVRSNGTMPLIPPVTTKIIRQLRKFSPMVAAQGRASAWRGSRDAARTERFNRRKEALLSFFMAHAGAR